MRRRGGGAIVNVASIAAHTYSPLGGGAYAASKAGLLALTRQTAHEWARYRIRANAVCPGPTRSELTRASTRQDADFPLGAWVQPGDVARAVRFLASPEAAMCTGAVLDVDGGVGVAGAPAHRAGSADQSAGPAAAAPSAGKAGSPCGPGPRTTVVLRPAALASYSAWSAWYSASARDRPG